MADILSRTQYLRSQRLVRSDEHTRVVHEGYPPCRKDPTIVVVWDPLFHGGRWALAREAAGWVEEGGSFAEVSYLRLFYYWEGPGDSFLHPSESVRDGVHSHVGMVQWLRDHDLYSESNCGEWDDRMFGTQAALEEEQDASYWDDQGHKAAELFDQFGRKLDLPKAKAGIDCTNKKYWLPVAARG